MAAARSLAVLVVAALVCALGPMCAMAGKELDMAISMGRAAAVRRVLNKGVESVNDMAVNSSPPVPALAVAISTGKMEIAKIMIQEYDADVNLKDGQGLTAMDAAAFMCDLEIMKLIWEYGGKDKLSTAEASEDGFHWLHRTLWSDAPPTECAEAITWIVAEAGVDVNVKVKHESRAGSTAMHEAANIGKAAQMHALLEAGADVNALSDDGNSPLHALCALAGYYNYIPAAALLVGKGADKSLLNKDGKTALELLIAAQEHAQEEIDKRPKFKNPKGKPMRVEDENGKMRTLNPNYVPRSMRVYQKIASFIDPDTDWAERFPMGEEELEREKQHVERANAKMKQNKQADL